MHISGTLDNSCTGLEGLFQVLLHLITPNQSFHIVKCDATRGLFTYLFEIDLILSDIQHILISALDIYMTTAYPSRLFSCAYDTRRFILHQSLSNNWNLGQWKPLLIQYIYSLVWLFSHIGVVNALLLHQYLM